MSATTNPFWRLRGRPSSPEFLRVPPSSPKIPRVPDPIRGKTNKSSGEFPVLLFFRSAPVSYFCCFFTVPFPCRFRAVFVPVFMPVFAPVFVPVFVPEFVTVFVTIPRLFKNAQIMA